MSHGAFGGFHQHGEDGLLEGEAEVFHGVLAFFVEILDEAEDAREGDVHSFDGIR